MEKIYFIKNGDLEFINNELLRGATVKMIQPCAEGIAAFGYSSHEICCNEKSDYYLGDIYTYIVLEYK